MMRRAPALLILAVAVRKSASALSNSLAATPARVRFMYVLMIFFAIRLCIRRLTLCLRRLIAEGVFGISGSRGSVGPGSLGVPGPIDRGPGPGVRFASKPRGYHEPSAQFKL